MSFSLEVMPKLLCFSSTYLSNWKDTCQEFYTRKNTYEIMQGYDWATAHYYFELHCVLYYS